MAVLYVMILLAFVSVGAFKAMIPLRNVGNSQTGITVSSDKNKQIQSNTIFSPSYINQYHSQYAQVKSSRQLRPLKDLLGLGPAEIAVTLVVALVLFGPETLKSLSKDVGRAAAELKEIPKTFKEGMDEGAESAQVTKMKAIAAEKRKKRDQRLADSDGDSGDDE